MTKSETYWLRRGVNDAKHEFEKTAFHYFGRRGAKVSFNWPAYNKGLRIGGVSERAMVRLREELGGI